MDKKKVYIAGPMTGLPEHNFPAFNCVEKQLEFLDFEPINPAKNFEGRVDLPRESYLRADIMELVACDHIYLLQGWETSEGARLEKAVADACGIERIEIMCLKEPEPVPELKARMGILPAAMEITSGDRHKSYGDPSRMAESVCDAFAAVCGVRILPSQFIALMIILKLCRENNLHKPDNLVDICGYARLLSAINGEEAL